MGRLVAFCKASPKDGVCVPQAENPEMTFERRMAAVATPELAPWVAESAQDRRIPNVRAVFLMAPAIVQAFEPGELGRLEIPVSVVVGEADSIASPATNSRVIAEANGKVRLQALPSVGHYDFLADCTALGRERVGPPCEVVADKGPTHQAAIRQATELFDSALR